MTCIQKSITGRQTEFFLDVALACLLQMGLYNFCFLSARMMDSKQKFNSVQCTDKNHFIDARY